MRKIGPAREGEVVDLTRYRSRRAEILRAHKRKAGIARKIGLGIAAVIMLTIATFTCR